MNRQPMMKLLMRNLHAVDQWHANRIYCLQKSQWDQKIVFICRCLHMIFGQIHWNHAWFGSMVAHSFMDQIPKICIIRNFYYANKSFWFQSIIVWARSVGIRRIDRNMEFFTFWFLILLKFHVNSIHRISIVRRSRAWYTRQCWP